MDNIKIETITRFYHCHKMHKHIEIVETYKIINGQKTLTQIECPLYRYTGDPRGSCNGLNDFGFRCCYADPDPLAPAPKT